MSKPLYVIGPSGVGKTTAAEALALSRRIRHVELDVMVKAGNPDRQRIDAAQDWDVVGPILEELEGSDAGIPTVVVLGAGTQDRDREHNDRNLETWLTARRDRVILIEGDPDILYSRSAAHRDVRERFDVLEFGEARCRIYRLAGRVVSFKDADRQEAVARLERAIFGLDETSV